MNLDQGEKHYSFQVSENIFSSIALQKNSELNHLNSVNSENLYAMASNNNEIKESPNVLEMSKDNEDKAFSMSNIVILDKEIEQNKRLRIQDHEGELLNGNTLTVNAGGLDGGRRQMRDGYTFFGSLLKKDNCIINDYIVNNHPGHDENYKNDRNTNANRLFVIFFELKTQTYYIRGLKDNNQMKGTSNEIINHLLMQVIHPFPIQHKSYFSFGMAAIAIEPINNSDSIIISVLDSGNSKEYSFNKENRPEITIGRKKSCNVHIPMTLVSKIHCTIIYDKEKNYWSIINGYKNKKSTNGLWYLIRKKHPIEHDISYIKVGTDVIKISMIDNE